MTFQIRMFHGLVLILGLALAGCQTASAPVQEPLGDFRPIIDPRSGYTMPAPEAASGRFGAAWNALLAGRMAEGQRKLADVQRRFPDYQPAFLADAALALSSGDAATALRIAEEVRSRADYPAARIYRAEALLRTGAVEQALEAWTAIASESGAPAFARTRVDEATALLYDDLVARASATTGENAIALYRRALTLRTDAHAIRIALVKELLNLRKYDEARRQLEPVIQARQMEKEVQESLVEIEVGRGRYQDAISRLERLSRSHPDPAYDRRLQEIKTRWNDANLPPQYHAALSSSAVTRADVAILLYWKIPAVRFATSLSEPPIAVDVADVQGREELVRAMALRLFTVDALTRRVDPARVVTSSQLMRTLARLPSLRAASCAASSLQEPNETERAEKIFAACGLSAVLPAGGDVAVTGTVMAALAERIDALSDSAK